MSDKKDIKLHQLTFSQREGHVDLPDAFKPGALIKQFKNEIWRLLEIHINQLVSEHFSLALAIGGKNSSWYWKDFFTAYQEQILERPHDEIEILDNADTRKWIRFLIFEGEYDEIITMLECMLRTPHIPEEMATDIEGCFDELSAYFVDRSSNPVCVIPSSSKEMKASTKSSLKNINQSQLESSKTHLNKAAKELNNKDFPASVRESIHALEAAVLQTDHSSLKDFKKAVTSLAEKDLLKHPTWQVILNKLYGYASDRKGVRHADSKPEDAEVDFNEAILVYGVCVSFVDYLASQSATLKDK